MHRFESAGVTAHFVIRTPAVPEDRQLRKVSHHLCPCSFPDVCHCTKMIVVRLCREQDPDIPEPESKLLNTVPDHFTGRSKTGIDKDMPFRCSDKVRCEVISADIVQVSSDSEWFRCLRPVRRTFRRLPHWLGTGTTRE